MTKGSVTFKSACGCYNYIHVIPSIISVTQPAFTCSKLTKETLEQCVKYVRKKQRRQNDGNSVNFEHVIADWVIKCFKIHWINQKQLSHVFLYCACYSFQWNTSFVNDMFSAKQVSSSEAQYSEHLIFTDCYWLQSLL